MVYNAKRKMKSKDKKDMDVIRSSAKPGREGFIQSPALIYWRAQKKAFINSFKLIPRKVFFKSLIFDFLTLLSLLLVFVSAFAVINRMSQPLLPELVQLYSLQTVAQESGDYSAFDEALSQYSPRLYRLVWLSFIVIVVSFLLCLFFVSVFYTKAWALAKKNGLSSSAVRKSFLLNLLWFFFWFAVVFLTGIIFRTVLLAFVLLLEMVLFFYLDFVLRGVFDEKKRVSENILCFARTGVKFYWFAFFILFSFIILFLAMLLLGLLGDYPVLVSLLFLLFTLIFIGWSRNYVLSLLDEMKEMRE